MREFTLKNVGGGVSSPYWGGPGGIFGGAVQIENF